MQNPEISKQNIGDDPTDRPKITGIATTIKRGSELPQSCVTEIILTLNGNHGDNSPNSIKLLFPSAKQYDIHITPQNTSFPTPNSIKYDNIPGKAYDCTHSPIEAKVNNEPTHDTNITHNYYDQC